MLGSSLHQLGNFTQLMPTQDETTKSQHVFTIAVEGNIGCGKSTFLQHFKQNPKVEVLPEPVDKWKCVKGYNSLDLMYRDAARWSFAFQSYVTLTMMEHHETNKESPKVKMIERSIYSTRHCFIENLHQGGLIPDIDYTILSEWHDWLHQNPTTNIDLIVYLRASPQKCFDRIHKRNRDEEKDVPIKVVASKLKVHLETNHLAESFQSAYKTSHSTETALVRIHNVYLMLNEEKTEFLLIGSKHQLIKLKTALPSPSLRISDTDILPSESARNLGVILNSNMSMDAHITFINRACYYNIHNEYLNSLHKLHEDWLIEKKKGELPAPLLVIDADLGLVDLQAKISQMESRILSGNLS